MGDKTFGNGKADKKLECLLRSLYFGQTSAGANHAHKKEQHQQGVAGGLQHTVDPPNHRPYSAVSEVFRPLGDQDPDL